MNRRVTLQDIAKRLGIHFTTVSRGLRNDRRLTPETISAIQTAALEMGYEPDPNARAMAVYRQAIRPVIQHGTLAMLTSDITENIYLEGARNRAHELGYQIDVILHRELALTGSRLTQVLKSRGISGLLVFPMAMSPLLKRLQLDWSQFSAVSLGNTLLWPPLHRVTINHFRNAKFLTRKLTSLGYRRIGFFINEQPATLQSDHGWRGGYLVEMERWGPPPAPLYRIKDHYSPSAIQKWIRTERLDAVITDYDYSAERLAALSGLKVPEKLGVASLASTRGRVSGIDQHYARIGAMSVDFLVHLLQTNQRGIPDFPQRLLLEGSWFPGQTVRRI